MINETAKSTVILDGKQAEDSLKTLQKESTDLRQEMERLRKANDLVGYEKLKKQVDANTKAQRELKKELFSVDKVMANLSGASMNQLKAAQRSINSELNKMTRGTKEYVRESEKLKKVNAEIANVKREYNSASDAQSGMFSRVGSLVTKFAGYIAAAWGAIRVGTAIINSAQAASDKWEATVTGLNFGLQSVMKSIATMDFSNFFTNIKEAIKAGREYAQVLDDLGDRNRAYKVTESELRIQIEELERLRDNVLLSSQERINAALRIDELEKKSLQENNALKQDAFQNEVNRIKAFTKLSDQEIKQFVKLYNAQKPTREEAEAYQNALDDLNKQITSINTNNAMMMAGAPAAARTFNTNTSEVDKLNKKIKELNQTTPEVVRGYASVLKSMGRTTDDELNSLVESWVNLNGAELTYLQNTQKNQRKLNDLKKTLSEEERKQIEEDFNNKLSSTEDEFRKLNLIITQNYNDGKISADEYHAQMLMKEWAYLNAKLILHKKFGKDTLDIEQEIANKMMKSNEDFELFSADLDKQNADFKNQFSEDVKKENEDIQKNIQGSTSEYVDGVVSEFDRLQEQYKQQAETARGFAEQFGSSFGDAIGTLMSDQEGAQKEFGKKMTLMALDSLDAVINIAIGKIWAQSLSSPEAIATAGAAGIAKAAIITALLKAATGGLKALVMASMNQRYEGKYDVIGADDGRTYRNVPYKGAMRTGVYGTPTIVAERGDELIVDNATLRNLQINFPHVLPTIKEAMVPQRASGNVSALNVPTPAADPELKLILKQQAAVINALSSTLKEGLKADITYSRAKDRLDKGAAAENRASRTP